MVGAGSLLGLSSARLRAHAGTLSAAVSAGMLLGFFIGGIGSRLAMRILFLTSPPWVKGMRSDDGFIIGRFSLPDTAGLVLLGTFIGTVGGVTYLAIRPFLPRPMASRSALCGLFYGLLGGSAIVHSDGIDFRLLIPRWLAVAMFVGIPTIFGLLVPVLVEKLDEAGSVLRRSPSWAGLLPLVVLAFPPLLVVVGAGILVLYGPWLISRNVDALGAFVDGPAFVWVGRAVVAGVAAWAAAGLYRDVTAIIV